MKDNKAIKVTPEELTFDQILYNQTYIQQLTMKNSLSAPVDIMIRSSNTDRFDIEPKQKKLAPFESFTIDVVLKVTKPFAQKTPKHKENIFIKSDFFDQKVNVTIIPSPNPNQLNLTGSTTPRESSLQSSQRISNNQFKNSFKRDQSKDAHIQVFGGAPLQSSFDSRMEGGELSPNFRRQSLQNELEIKEQRIREVCELLKKQESETQNAMNLYQQEKQKRKEAEERINSNQSSDNQEYLSQVKQLLREKEPSLEQLMDLTLKKEKDIQERKDAKVLEILKVKDRHIEDLQTKLVNQETEYGKLAQIFQEQKKRLRQMEDEELDHQRSKRELEEALEAFRSRVETFEKGKEYRRLLEVEEKLKEASEIIQKYEQELGRVTQELGDKSQIEHLYEEALQRAKDQIRDKEGELLNVTRELNQEREMRMREEDTSKLLEQQMTQLTAHNEHERSQIVQKQRQDQDLMSRITKLQDEKREILENLEEAQTEKRAQENRMREIYDRMLQIRGLGGLGVTQQIKGGQKSIFDLVERKFEDLARLISEFETDNLELVDKNRKLQDILTQREQELQQVIEENEDLASKVKRKVKSTHIQTEIESQDLEIFDSLRDRCADLEDSNERLRRQNSEYERRMRNMEGELDSKNQEITLIMRSSQNNSGIKGLNNQRQSVTTASELINHSNQYSTQQDQNSEEVISRLNAKITQMKVNEDRLLEELAFTKQQQSQSQPNEVFSMRSYQSNQPLVASSQPSVQKSNIALEERMGEYEMIVLEQREQLIKLEDENSRYRLQVSEIKRISQQQIEELQLRLKNLQELNQKHEQINNQLMNSQASAGEVLFTAKSSKSTAVDTERMRQYSQQLELNNMALRHQIEEFKSTLQNQNEQIRELKDELIRVEQVNNRLKQDIKVSKVQQDNGQDSKLSQTILQQRNKIKQLQGLLMRAKQDFDQMRQTGQINISDQNRGNWESQRDEELQKTNERLRKEHHQAIMAVIDLKDEYSAKLQIIAEKSEQQRQKMRTENQGLQRKLETLQQQLQYMEKKELRLFNQLEETKRLEESEAKERESRTKELEDLLFKKEETINDLTREIAKHEKTLHERQEQLAVLINTLEQEHSQDETRQKLLNQSAELCSMKAIQSQNEKRINELVYQLKKTEVEKAKFTRIADNEKSKIERLQSAIKKLEDEVNQNELKVQDLQMKLKEKEREVSETVFTEERTSMQIQLKDETIGQLREQVKRGENLFKEEVERLRREFLDQVNKEAHHQVATGQLSINKALQFKTAIQHLHLVVSECINHHHSQDGTIAVIQEFERALSVASQTIEKLQTELDKQLIVTAHFQADLKASALSKILVSRLEQLQINYTRLISSQAQREEEREAYIRDQMRLSQKIIKEQESKLNGLLKENNQLESENQDLHDQLRIMKDQKEELESSLLMFEQELESKRQFMEKQAELNVDERFKTKHEAIKSYFDSNITRLLLNSGQSTNEKILELGREIVSLKLLITKYDSNLQILKSENQSLDLNLSHTKEQYSLLEQKLRESNHKYHQLQSKTGLQEIQQRVENEKKKQLVLSLEKQLLVTKEQLEDKSREIRMLSQQVSKDQDDVKAKRDQLQVEEQVVVKEQVISKLQSQNEELHQKLIDQRAQQIQEIEELRGQFDLDIAEQRRLLAKEKEMLEKRYMPGYAPGELMEQQQELQGRVVELKSALDRIIKENAVLRKRYDQEKSLNQSNRNEIQSYKQALQELESTMLETVGQQNQSQQNQSQQNQSERLSGVQVKKHKFNPSSNKKEKLMFISQASESKLGQSSMMDQSQSSLNVSTLTANNTAANARQSFQATPQGRGFIQNPPQLVRALVQAKVGEMLFKKKCEEYSQFEIELRQQIKKLLLEQENRQECEDENDLRRKLAELQVENEDLKIARAEEQVDRIQLQQIQNLKQAQSVYGEQNNYCQQDQNLLIESILSLTLQLAEVQNGSQQRQEGQNSSVEESQRLVIRSLHNKLSELYGQQLQSLNYVPSEEQDRKLWYIELLEQQVTQADQVIQQLQTFVKRVQIDVQGSVQSAAQIKAASMDLAHNTKKTSDEVNSLRNIVGLVKHDLLKNQKPINHPQGTTLNQATMNPFSQETSRRQEQMVDSLQNQLLISEKVRKTLEEQVVQLKVAHAQELQSISQRLSQALDQRDSLLSTNEELHEKTSSLQSKLDTLKNELQNMSTQNAQNQSLVMEKERDKQLMNQTKQAASKQLQRLQQDMHDWRKQSEDNMKTKDNQIADLREQLSSVTSDRDRLKSENQMLRRNEKDRKSTKNEDLKRLEQENKELGEKLRREIDDRKKEIEFWVQERATMREMIDQLENDKVEVAAHVFDDKQEEVKTQTTTTKKLQKKIKQKDLDLKSKDRELQQARDEINQIKQKQTQLEQRLRESQSKQTEAEERMRFYSQRLKEAELERDLVLAEKNNALQSNDVTAAQIQVELNSLRECFAKLKVERDNLLYEIESGESREREWKQTVEKLSEDLQRMENNFVGNERNQSIQIRDLETKNHTLMTDLKYIKQENDRLKERVKELDKQQMDYEQKIHAEQMRQQESLFQIENNVKSANEFKTQIRNKEQTIQDMQNQIVVMEAGKMKEILDLKQKLEDVKEANGQIIALYEGQIAELRQRFIQDKKKTEQQVDQMFSLAQREAVIKNLKKELTQAKSSLNKTKSKNKELKTQVNSLQNQENQQVNSNKYASRKPERLQKGKENVIDETIDKNALKQAQLIIAEENGGYAGILDQIQKTNQVLAKFVEMQADLEKSTNWNMVVSQQLQDQQEANQQLIVQIQQLEKGQLKESKIQKSQVRDNEMQKQYKQEIKSLQDELEQMKAEWISPADSKALQEKVKDHQTMIKSLKEEVSRKKDVINQLKQQREQTEVEANQIISDMEGLKDDNVKLQKLIRENTKNASALKELKASNDQMKLVEKRLKEESRDLGEKLRLAKLDLTRKDQIIKEYKDKLDFIQDEVNQSKDRLNEIERLKDLNKKLKLDTEIKENQVKSLKVKVDHLEEEMETMKNSMNQSNQVTSQSNSQLESQIKIGKNKIKKQELQLRKCLEALRKIGKELTNQSMYKSTSNKKKGKPDQPMLISEFEKDFYKDSVNILGVSMDELEDFINPSQMSGISVEKSQENQQFMARLDKVVEIPESLNQDIDQIATYCIKLINEMNPDVKLK